MVHQILLLTDFLREWCHPFIVAGSSTERAFLNLSKGSFSILGLETFQPVQIGYQYVRTKDSL